jgi:hypothetical protein
VKPQAASVHERLAGEEMVRGSSDRSFGLVIAGVLGLLGLWPLVGGRPVRAWSLAVAVAFLVLALVLPRALAPLNRLWFRTGLLLHAGINPVIMGLLFYTTVTPTGLIMRLLGKDPLRLQFDRQATTYWIPRCPPGPSPDTMRRQF